MNRKTFYSLLPLLLLHLASGGAATLPASSGSATYFLPATVEVDSSGVFLDQLVHTGDAPPLPHVRVAGAPRFGGFEAVTRMRITSLLREQSLDLLPEHWTGADAVRISRKARVLEQHEIQALITGRLQEEHVEAGDRLEIEFTRPWSAIQVPDEPLSLHLSPLPAAGISSYLIVRFSIEAGGERFGPWQLPVRARVWRDMWVVDRPLKRGDLLTRSDLRRQPLDALRHRDAFRFPENNAPVEVVQDLVRGRPLTHRHVRLRPLVKRRQIVDARYQRGSISITMKVEVLEDGVGGQLIRVRNNESRRELHARVLMEGVVSIEG